MQGLDTSTGNKILRFSLLMEILPYWDSPFKWMQFCMKMNKKTQEIWKMNCNAFCIRAEKMKRNVKCSYILTERMITSIVRNHNLYKKLTFCSKDIKSLMNIVKKINRQKSCCTSSFKRSWMVDYINYKSKTRSHKGIC